MRRLLLLASVALVLASTARANEELLLLAEKGVPAAQHELCYGYLYGVKGMPEDAEAAFMWCSAAAETGWAGSQTLLAEMYRFGTHVARDDAKARDLYRLAAVQGHVHAQFMLGYISLLEREPTKATVFEACYWLRAAESRGYEKAQQVLQDVESRWGSDEGPGFCEQALQQARYTGGSSGHLS